MDSLDRFSRFQPIVEEFVSDWLADISGDFARLVYIAMLRNVSSGSYHHPALAELYGESSVRAALQYCHDELFQKISEASLDHQEWVVRLYFAGQEEPAAEIASRWLEVEYFRLFVPFGTPIHMRDLFFSNMRKVLSQILAGLAVTSSV